MKDRTGAEYPTNRPTTRPAPPAPPNLAAPISEGAGPLLAPGGERLTGLAPVVSERTVVLVLGSFPGAASLRAGQYYAHPQNHFWRILQALWPQHPLPDGQDYGLRCDWLLARGLGLWDVAALVPVLGGAAAPETSVRRADPPPDWREAAIFVVRSADARPAGSRSDNARSDDSRSSVTARSSDPAATSDSPLVVARSTPGDRP